jgi:acyl-CoA thioesterase FadM
VALVFYDAAAGAAVPVPDGVRERLLAVASPAPE